MEMDSELIKILAIFTVISLIVSVLLYFAINSWRGCKRSRKKAEEMVTWPTTTASANDWKVIYGSYTRGRFPHYKPQITYSYYLDGKEYFINVTDKKFNYYRDRLESEQDAKKDAAALGRSIVEERKRIQIYYNPNDPSESVAEIAELGSCTSIFVMVVILSIVLLISASIALFVLASFVIPLFRH